MPEESVEALSEREEKPNALLLAIMASDVDSVDNPTCVAKTPDESVLKDDNVILEKAPVRLDNDDTDICNADKLNVVDDMDDNKLIVCDDRFDPMTVENDERPV